MFKRRTFATMAMLIAIAAFSGCGLLWEDPYIAVTANPLNWIEIHYYNANHEPVRRVSVRITGAGFVEAKSGTSRLISDSFAKDNTDSTWEDIRSSRYNVDPEHVKEIFQDLVNAGLFDKDKCFRSTSKPSQGRFIAIRAAMDNKTYSEPLNIFEADPELAERLYNIVLEFNRPVLGRKRKQ